MPVVRPLKINLTTGEIERFGANDFINEVDILTVTNNTGEELIIGTPVILSAVADEVQPAQANALLTSRVAGLVADVSIADAASGAVITDGRLSATTVQWDAVTGQSGGLTPGAKYYLSATQAGGLTTTPPSSDGQVIAPIGTAKSATELSITVERLIVL